MIHNLADLFPEHYRDCIYDLLPFMPNDVCADIGAANGATAKKILAASETMKLVAFEPFPGNIRLFEAALQNLDVILEQQAVSDSIGEATFVVPKVVSGSEPGWEDQIGYSSVGYLAAVRSPSNLFRRLKNGAAKRLLGQVFRRQRPRILRVSTTTLDAYFGEESLDFVKIDTQGAEYRVLLGAQALMTRSGIGCLYIEYEDHDDSRIVKHLIANDFVLFDSVLILYSQVDDVQCSDLHLTKLRSVDLSTGFPATEARVQAGSSVDDAIRALEARNIRFHVDLIAVHQDRLEAFEQAIVQLRQDGGSQ